MNFFKNLSIKIKLILIFILISVLTISLCASLFIFNDINMLKETTVRNLSVLAETIGDNCVASLLFDDPDSAEKILASMKKEYQIQFGVLYNAEGDIFALYKNDENVMIHPAYFEGEGHIMDYAEGHEKDIQIVRNIVFENKIIGKIYLHAQMLELEIQKNRYALLTGLLLLITLLISSTVALKLQKIISKPILLLADEAKTISEEGKYDIAVQYESKDELGTLYSSFNKMISRIKQREQDLVDIKDNLEKLVSERTKELNEAKNSAEIATRAKSQFLAHMSHELRTPLNAIVGLSDLATRTQDENRRDEYINLVSSSGKILRDLVNNVLDISKIESGKMELEEIPFNLQDAIEKATILLTYQACQKGLLFSTSVDPGLPRLIFGDSMRLRQIIMNLAGNAVKFTEKGEVKINVRLKEIKEKRAKIHFSIQDTGPGISKKKLETIFDSFTQEDVSTTRKYGGTGLGTAISRQLVELMNGSIWMESKPGEGTVVHFVISFNICDETIASQILDHDTRRRSISLAGKAEGPFNILVADDNLLNQRVSVDILKILGHKVSSANNGKTAVEMWEKGNYDLVLMDIMMPEMDGFQATREIRKREADSDERVPIVALTGQASSEIMEECIKAGMDDFIFKPVDFEKLVEKIGWAYSEKREKEKNKEKKKTEGEHGEALFDLDYLRKKLNYDNKMIDDLLEWFKEDSNNLISSMEKAIKENDSKTLEKAAHKLRGSAQQINAAELKRLANELEAMGKERDITKAAGKLKSLKACYKRLLKELRKE